MDCFRIRVRQPIRAELEEERRLAYVAMTRAERFLYVTHAMKRRVYGEELASEPSQFLNEMPIDLIEDLSLGKSWLSFARGSSDDRLRARRVSKREEEVYGQDLRQRRFDRGVLQATQPAVGPDIRQLIPKHPRRQRPTSSASGEFVPGSYVKHSKYGRGLVLRREGAGESTKLTVSFRVTGRRN